MTLSACVVCCVLCCVVFHTQRDDGEQCKVNVTKPDDFRIDDQQSAPKSHQYSGAKTVMRVVPNVRGFAYSGNGASIARVDVR